MSPSIPVAPPPPTVAQKKTVPYAYAAQQSMEECLWAAHLPELQKGCYFARVCSVKAPKVCRYYDIINIMQQGPTCGLTAISMLLNNAVTPAELLAEAQNLQYSNNGEMFSASYLYNLLCKHLSETVDANANINCKHSNDREQIPTKCAKECNGKTKYLHCTDCQLYEGQLNCAKVKKALIDGACLLVPYPFHYVKLTHKNLYIFHFIFTTLYILSAKFFNSYIAFC